MLKITDLKCIIPKINHLRKDKSLDHIPWLTNPLLYQSRRTWKPIGHGQELVVELCIGDGPRGFEQRSNVEDYTKADTPSPTNHTTLIGEH
ncbi:hypothetical protein TNCV_3910631 [Trichonephila clavipes]|nr:hypothetical protein TNCV_3910631 [Trichonephila clavipes]